MNKGISTPIGIVIIVLVALLAGGILAWQYFGLEKKEIKAPEEKITDETADWQTYRNEEYGFEIKYPPNWEWEPFKREKLKEVQETTKRVGGVIDSVEFSPEGRVYEYAEVCGRDLCRLPAVGIYVSIKSNLNQYLNAIPEDKKKEIFINNIQITEVKGYKSYLTTEEGAVSAHDFFIEKSDIAGYIRIADNIYGFEKAGSISSEEEKEMHKLFNQMLSTFKFIEVERFISEEEAINLIKNLPEVKKWLTLFTGPGGTGPTTGGKPMIVVDSKSDEGYTIHVYEQLTDHTATFNWYSVNSKTGKIIPMFER